MIKVFVTCLGLLFFPVVANATINESQKADESELIAQFNACNLDNRCREQKREFYGGFGGNQNSSSSSQQAPQPNYCNGKGCSTVRTGGYNYPQSNPYQYNRRPVFRRY
jgi:hypothetical protein